MVIFVKFIRPRKELDIADIQIAKYPPIYQASILFSVALYTANVLCQNLVP